VSEKRLTCPWCAKRLVIQSGGWAYRRSQIVLHLTTCKERPPDTLAADVNITADAIVESESEDWNGVE
jgi:hypothetical protein